MSSSIPSRIDNYLKDLQYHTLQPIGITTAVNPTFTLKEDKLLPVSVKFTPIPTCTCSSYHKSIRELPHPLCYHIVYILTHYYHINSLSIRMYHKLPDNFYEKLISYMDTWITSNHVVPQLRKQRKKPNYDFRKETKKLLENYENQDVLNPMYDYYNNNDCVICLDPLSAKQHKLIICPECYNYSHQKCATKWLVKKQGCPICRDNPTKTKIEEYEMFPDLVMSSKPINNNK